MIIQMSNDFKDSKMNEKDNQLQTPLRISYKSWQRKQERRTNPFERGERLNIPNFDEAFAPYSDAKESRIRKRPQVQARKLDELEKENSQTPFSHGKQELSSQPFESITSTSFANFRERTVCPSSQSSSSGSSFMNMSMLSIGCRAALNEHQRHIAKYGLDLSLNCDQQSQQTPSPLSCSSPNDEDKDWDHFLDGGSSCFASTFCDSSPWDDASYARKESPSNSEMSDFFNSSRVLALETPIKNIPIIDEASERARHGMELCRRDDRYGFDDEDDFEINSCEEDERENSETLAENVVREILGIRLNSTSSSEAVELSKFTTNELCESKRYEQVEKPTYSVERYGFESSCVSPFIGEVSRTFPNAVMKFNLFDMSPIVSARQVSKEDVFSGSFSPFDLWKEDSDSSESIRNNLTEITRSLNLETSRSEDGSAVKMTENFNSSPISPTLSRRYSSDSYTSTFLEEKLTSIDCPLSPVRVPSYSFADQKATQHQKNPCHSRPMFGLKYYKVTKMDV